MPHEYTFSFPKASCTEFKTIRYCPDTNKVCLPDVLLVLGKEPCDYIERYMKDGKLDDVIAMCNWQANWDEIMQKAREKKPVCAVCGVEPSKTLRCAVCLKHRVEVVYCSAACRDQDWPEHKRVCLKKAAPSTLARLQRVADGVMRIKREIGQ